MNDRFRHVREQIGHRWLNGAAIGYLQSKFRGLTRLEIESIAREEVRERIEQARRRVA